MKVYTCQVIEDWVDYNGHLNDAEYARIFSLSIDAFMNQIGISNEFLASDAYTLFTLETHVCFLDEVSLGEKVSVDIQLLDVDAKRLHVFLTMLDSDGNKVATSEQMLMGMDLNARRPAPFPDVIQNNIDQIKDEQKTLDKPKEAGRTIGIRRK